MKILAKKLHIVLFFTFAIFAIVSFGFAAQTHADWSFDDGYYYNGSDYTDYGPQDSYYSNTYPDSYSYNDAYQGGYYSYNNGYYNGNCSNCNSSYYSSGNSYNTCGSGCNNNYVPPVVNNYVLPIVVSCVPSTYNMQTGQTMTWSANVSGGNGNYQYSWSGTDGLSGGGSSQSKSYSSSGTKSAHVNVTSDGKTGYADCGSVYVNDNYQNFDVSCSIDDYNVNVGDQVHMSANASGGNGDYSYTWYGAYPLDGRTGSSQYVTYNSEGDKDVRVTVRSNGQERTRSCGTVHVGNNYNSSYNYNYYNNDLNISCTVNSATAAVGQNVIWNTTVTGGNGSYYYSWTGTDALYGNGSTISRSYPTAGIKSSTVTVTSNGQTKSLACPTVNVGGGVAYQTPNQGNLASLSSVYLNQVPYTGVGDNPKLMMFVIGLILWSGAMAYAIIYRRAKSDRKNAILDFKKENMAKRGLM